MKERYYRILSLIFALLMVLSCRSDTNPVKKIALFESSGPVMKIGADSEEVGAGVYEALWTYTVDDRHQVYIADQAHFRVDKFDRDGHYLFSFGGKDHESMKYPGWINTIAVDEQENLLAYCPRERKFLLFSATGQSFKVIDINDELKKLAIKKMAFYAGRELLLLGYSGTEGYLLSRYDLETKHYRVFHRDNRRTRPGFTDLLPDFAFDRAGNVYVTDTIAYRVFKYSPAGRSLYTFNKEANRHKIEERDFHVLLRRNKIREIPNYREDWKMLKGASRYFPAIFGIHIDGERVFIWRSDQDKEKKYRLDVYDMGFKYLGTSSYYNSLGHNLAFIKDRLFYMPDIGHEDTEYKGHIGRFSIFNLPHRIDVFQIPGSLYKNSLQGLKQEF